MENLLGARDRVGVADFVLLENYQDTDAFIDNLRKRFDEGVIYTYIGQVVVSVNPYRNIDIYNDKYIEMYRNTNFFEMPPHVFAISDNAYRMMCEHGNNHCILISGESGSGKTEASKKILTYLSAISTTKSDCIVHQVKDKLLKSNPVLEAFGNAQTNRNCNSSRFGKYMDIEFDVAGMPIGGHITNYLLEKSRVIFQGEGERNFHVFYQLIAGAGDQLLGKLQLTKNLKDYHYLNQGNSGFNTGAIEDSTGFDLMVKALKVFDISAQQEEFIFKILGAVLHLGNIQFADPSDDYNGNKATTITTKTPLKNAAKMLGCTEVELQQALVTRSIEAAGQIITSPLSAEQAANARDALAKALYERLFSWLVNKLNLSLTSKKSLERRPEFRRMNEKDRRVIGLLDIYGFEIFDRNSFEQFCINYCNEKLQQLFIELTLKSEQMEYKNEAIEWEQVEYFDNQIICDLIELKFKGIISILDEECLRPGDASDDTFLEKLTNSLRGHFHFETHLSADSKTRKTLGRKEFRIKHYAGQVDYQVDGFLDKNVDSLFRNVKETMAVNCENQIVKQCFEPDAKQILNKKRPETVSTQFKGSLAKLMDTLKSKEPSYVRCIKPNDCQRPAMFDAKIVRHQVQYLGLMENLRVRRAGFAYRREYEVFLNRYKCLCPQTWPVWKGSVKDGVQVLVNHLGYQRDEYRMGRTKIFIRFPRTLFATEDAFQRRKHYLATLIQTCYRRFIAQKKYQQIRTAVTMIASYWRRYKAMQELKRRRWAAHQIRRFIKGFITRNGPETDINRSFQNHIRKEWLRRLTNNLPKTCLDKSWPPAPTICQDASRHLEPIFRRNQVRRYCKLMSEETKNAFHEKILAEELFKGKKAAYPASVPHWFKPNRLSNELETLRQQVFEKRIKESQDERTVYALEVIKYDRHGYKKRPRLLVITTSAVYMLSTSSKSAENRQRIHFKSITGLEMSNLTDGLLIIKNPIESKGDKGDLIIDCGQWLIETVTKLMRASSLNPSLIRIESSGSLSHTMEGGKRQEIKFNAGSENVITKGKDGSLIVICRVN